MNGGSTSIAITRKGNTTITFFAKDNAGNLESAKTVTVRLDRTAPLITGSRTPPPNANGWNRTDVGVSFACSDDLSGLAPGSPPAAIMLSNEGGGQSATGSCQDIAGNLQSVTVSDINIDKIPPTITGTRAPVPNDSGWNSSDVTVSFTCSDSLSGIESCSPTPQVVSTEGVSQSRTATAVDLAGNNASATTTGISIDKTPPTLICRASPNVLWPPNHKLVNVTTWANVTDALSGSAGFTLTSITSNEPDNGLGDGDTPSDIQGWDIGNPDTTGLLRAERSGNGGGRSYRLTYTSWDKARNRATCVAEISVPHDR